MANMGGEQKSPGVYDTELNKMTNIGKNKQMMIK